MLIMCYLILVSVYVNHVLPYTDECVCTTFEVSKTTELLLIWKYSHALALIK